MSSDKKEYDVLKGLLSGNQKDTLSSEVILSCVACKSKSDLGDSPQPLTKHKFCFLIKNLDFIFVYTVT